MDPEELPIDRFCNLVYWWLIRNADERRRREIDTTLEAPPPGLAELEGAADEGVWSADAEMAAFAAAQAAVGR